MQQRLRALWTAPERFKPRRSNREITEEAASTFAGTAERLRAAGVAPGTVSHFLTQCTAHRRTEALADGALIPAGLAPEIRVHAEAIARAAKRLNDLREAWLNPPEWTERVPEVVPLGMSTSPYPDRILAKPGFEKELAKRTLTNLYNARPAWLAQAHATLDAAVAAAYGWADWQDTPGGLAEEEILRRLLALNHERSAAGARTAAGGRA